MSGYDSDKSKENFAKDNPFQDTLTSANAPERKKKLKTHKCPRVLFPISVGIFELKSFIRNDLVHINREFICFNRFNKCTCFPNCKKLENCFNCINRRTRLEKDSPIYLSKSFL